MELGRIETASMAVFHAVFAWRLAPGADSVLRVSAFHAGRLILRCRLVSRGSRGGPRTSLVLGPAEGVARVVIVAIDVLNREKAPGRERQPPE